MGKLAEQFVLVRLERITGQDLNLFEFDYDLTWAAFFLSPEEKIYGRYGGRDARSSDGRISLEGLRYAADAALAQHRAGGGVAVPRQAPLRAEDYPAAQKLRRNECIHCHQVYEFRRSQRQATGVWSRDERWLYPLPETLGLTLEKGRENVLQAVAAGSSAEAIGLRSGDVLTTVSQLPIASMADLQYALQKAPARGRLDLTWARAGQEMRGSVELKEGWRKTNLTWRPSLLDILPGLELFGPNLNVAERKTLGLAEKRLAFRQEAPVPGLPLKAGVRAGDVVLGFAGEVLETDVEGFLAHVRRNYLVGDKVQLEILREGKRLVLPLTLK